MSEKPTLNIVLVEPRIPQNTGNIARTCAVSPMSAGVSRKPAKPISRRNWPPCAVLLGVDPQMHTFAPSRMKSAAIPTPVFRLAPVTNTTLSLKRI